MTSTQLAAIAYRLGVIDTIADQLYQLTLPLDDLEEGSLSVKLELTVRAFDERAEEYRKTLNEYANEIPIDPTRCRKGDKPRPVNKQAYDDNYDAIFRSPHRRKGEVGTAPELPGSSTQAPTQDASAARATRTRYARRLGPDGQTWFVVAG